MEGLHITADIRACQCGDALLTEVDALREVCRGALAQAQLTAVGELFHSFGPGQGATGVMLLAESHLAIHTWPELRGATFDIYVCNYSGDNSPKAELALRFLMDAFKPRKDGIIRLHRGAVGQF